MSTWVTQRRAVAPEWHLEARRPGDKKGVVHTACGQVWETSPLAPIERRGDVDSIRKAIRCPACQAINVDPTAHGWP